MLERSHIMKRLAVWIPLLLAPPCLADDTCPTDLSAWQTYRDKLATTLSQTGGIDTGGTAYSFMQNCLAKLTDGSAAKQEAETCVERVRAFVSSEAVAGNSLGFSVPDADYYAQTADLTTFPPELATSEFLALVSSWDATDRLAAYFDTLNTKRATARLPAVTWMTYQTALTTPDAAQTPGRLLIVYPDPARHRTVWTQFGLLPPGSTAFSTHVFAITIVETAKGTREDYFHRWEKSRNADGTLSIGMPTDPTPLDACDECHKSGPLVLAPSQVEARFQDVNTQLKAEILGYGALSSPYDLGPTRGPSFGTPAADRPASFVETCAAAALNDMAADGKAELLAKLTRDMSCATCHNGTYRGKLTSPLNTVVMSKFFEDGLMPPGDGATLTSIQRESLLNCLTQEYFGQAPNYAGVLFKYLTEPACQ